MAPPQLPPELVSDIIELTVELLVEEERHLDAHAPLTNRFLRSASLVDRTWHSIATPVLLKNGIVTSGSVPGFLAQIKAHGMEETLESVRFGEASGGVKAEGAAEEDIAFDLLVGSLPGLVDLELLSSGSLFQTALPAGRAIRKVRLSNFSLGSGGFARKFALSPPSRLDVTDNRGQLPGDRGPDYIAAYPHLEHLTIHLLAAHYLLVLGDQPNLATLDILPDAPGLSTTIYESGKLPETLLLELIHALSVLKNLSVPACWASEAVREASAKTRKRQVGIYEVEETVPSFTNLLPGVSAFKWFDGFRSSLPFLWKLFAELAQGGGWTQIAVWTLTQVLLALFPALELWLSSQLLSFVQEAIDTRHLSHPSHFYTIAFLRVSCAVLNRILKWIDDRTDNVLSARLSEIFSRRILEAQLRLSLGTLSDPDTQRVFQQISSATGGAGSKPKRRGGEFSGIARGLSGLLSVVEMMAQGIILAGMLRQKREDRIYAVAALLGYVLSRWENSHMRKGDTWWCRISNTDYLRMQRLAQIGTTLTYKAEVEALGLEEYILNDYSRATLSLGLTSTVYPHKAARQQFSLVGTFRDMLSHFPLIHLAYTAAHSPNTVPLSLATITLVQSTTNRFAAKVESLANVSDGLADEVANFRNLFELAEMEMELKDGMVGFEKREGKGMEIEFRDVSFSYPGAPRPSVHGLSFKLQPGQLAIVVGINGGGKSTMIKLLSRLYDPSDGQVLINGRDARSYRVKELRAAIAVGWQDYVHFPLTIRENIALGDASSPSSMDDIIVASKLGGAHEFISSLPLGYETTVEPPQTGFGRLKNRGGVSLQDKARRSEEDKARELKLSGGQWQRLALARTMMRARKADLLVFDEPSASLDPKAESELFERLNELREGRTSIYITHRFGTFNKSADLVLFIAPFQDDKMTPGRDAKRNLLEEMEKTTNFSGPEIQRLKKRFMKLDQDNNGEIDKAEFLQIPQIANNPLSSRMIAIFDENGGGTVDFQEFVAGLSAFSSRGGREEKLKFAFKVYDMDRDGYISNGELFLVLKMMVGNNLKDQQLQQIVDKTMMEADQDGDGKLDFEEFKAMVANTDIAKQMTLEDMW
ncbi:hypothetical protein RQP46_006108 [Phenoliferia psychrophenolica]